MISLLLAVLFSSWPARQSAELDGRVRALIADSGADVAVAFRTLDGRSELLIDRETDEAMIAILRRQTFNEAIPAGVPAGTAVAHKTGTITRIHHDAGIVYGARPYVLVILVRGLDDKKKSAPLMAEISRVIFEAVPYLPAFE